MTTETQLYRYKTPLKIEKYGDGYRTMFPYNHTRHFVTITKEEFERDYEPVTVDDNGWRPIAEAPQDGRGILVYGLIKEADGYMHKTPSIEKAFFDGFSGNWRVLFNREIISATHFMLLPPAPKVPSGEDSGKKGFDYETRKKDWHKAPSGEE